MSIKQKRIIQFFKMKRWSEEEDALLETYPEVKSKIYELLPHRTKKAIKTRLGILGIKQYNVNIDFKWHKEAKKINTNPLKQASGINYARYI